MFAITVKAYFVHMGMGTHSSLAYPMQNKNIQFNFIMATPRKIDKNAGFYILIFTMTLGLGKCFYTKYDNYAT
jgi:hypothetical protein